MIVGAVPNTGVGTAVALTIDGIAASLNGVVARNDQDGTLIKLKLTEAAEKLVRDMVSGRRAA